MTKRYESNFLFMAFAPKDSSLHWDRVMNQDTLGPNVISKRKLQILEYI